MPRKMKELTIYIIINRWQHTN